MELEANFNRLHVVAFESRRAREAAAMIERFGGAATVAPSMREVPLEDNHAALDFARRLLAGEFDVIVLMTGVGFELLFRVMETRYPPAELVAALSKAVLVARGPKPIRALREKGLSATIEVPEPNTSRELVAAMVSRLRLQHKHIAVQEYGAPNDAMIAELTALGAVVTQVPVYRWTLPEDIGPLRDAVKMVAAGAADVVLFTSSNQLQVVLGMAEREGVGSAFKHALGQAVVASIGPVCTAALKAAGLPADLEPEHPKLGHLIKEAAEKSGQLLRAKRHPALHVEAASAQERSESLVGPRHPLHDHPLLKACRREPTPYTPVWLMRQAGRYMAEYRALRERYPFLELCRQPELAAQLTVDAARRLGVDAAIIFADILLPLLALGVGLNYEQDNGPVIERPVRTPADIERLSSTIVADSLGFVAEAIRLAARELGGDKPVIGFAGAPFTLASYLIEGGGSRAYLATKRLMYQHPQAWHRLAGILAQLTADYLRLQIDSGVAVVQIFDSWVGTLAPDDYRRYVLPHTQAVIASVSGAVPVIHFGTGTAGLLELIREAGGDVIGLDWRVDLAEGWKRLGDGVGVQGNLDPAVLLSGVETIREHAKSILDQAAGRPGHIFNLGHGILPDTPEENVVALVEIVHELSRR